MGQGPHQPQGNPVIERPLAPASWPVLAGVGAYMVAGSVAIALTISNDWVAVLVFVALIVIAVFILNKVGTERAAAAPHPLYSSRTLPADETTGRWRLLMVMSTLLVLIGVVIATARPGESGSPLPYFLAIGFLYLVMPQLTARIALRRYKS